MKLTSLIEGIALGAVGMYLLDPDRGGRRRALLRDQIIQEGNRKRRAVRIMTKDFVNRAQGLRHRLGRQFDQSQAASDHLLAERAKAEIGHVVSHAGAIEVSCENKVLTLTGPIVARELDVCLRHARLVPGVSQVVNNLEVHTSPEHISALQGGSNQAYTGRWTPATSLVMGVTGMACALYGGSRRGPIGALMKVGGMGMVAKAFRDTERRFERSNAVALPPKASAKTGQALQDGEAVGDRGQAGMI